MNEGINRFRDGRNSLKLLRSTLTTLPRWSMSFFPALLIVGPRKINTNHLRQTFGERFLMSHSTLEFANEFECLSIAFAILQTQNRVAWSEWCDHVSSRMRVVCVAEERSWRAIDRQNLRVDFHSKQIWKRCCKKSRLHYNAIPSLNFDCHLQVLDQRPVIDRLKVN